MPITLPLVCLILSAFAFRRISDMDWRGALLLAAVSWGGLVTLLTESLSALNALEFWPLACAWAIVCAALLAMIYRRQAVGHPQSEIASGRGLPRFDLLLLVYLAALIALTGLFAWSSPPNTWDSMTYHMSRIAHWMQNKTVDFYPTAILRQLHSNPWAEYAILNFQILSGNDRFANFVQWFSMIGSLVGTSALARELGASRRGQILASIACGTIPMGILQSTSTQTDYVAAFWLVCLVYFSIRLKNRTSWVDSFGFGSALGLGLLTKGTVYVFAFPFVAWLIVSSFRRDDRRKLVHVGLALMVALIANAGHYARNFELYGSPLGPGTEGGDFVYTNQIVNPSAVVSNMLRNAGLHLGTTSVRANTFAEGAIYRLHAHLGISTNDPRTTWPDTEFHVRPPSHNEDDEGNFVQLLLIAATLIVYFSGRRRDPKVTTHAFLILSSFVIFCAYLKWQPWHSRLQLPLFVLWAPFLGLMLSRIRRFGFGNALAIVLILSSLPSLLSSQTKPIQGKGSIFIASRSDQYFSKRRELEAPYQEATDVISRMKCTDVGLLIGGDDWEYPLWVLLNEKMNGKIHIEHVNVMNVSKKIHQVRGNNEFTPCAIFNLDPHPQSTISVTGRAYSKEWFSGTVNIFKVSD